MTEAVSALNADLARAVSASLRLAAAMAYPRDTSYGRMAVAAAQGDLERANAAVAADRAAVAVAPPPRHMIDLLM